MVDLKTRIFSIDAKPNMTFKPRNGAHFNDVTLYHFIKEYFRSKYDSFSKASKNVIEKKLPFSEKMVAKIVMVSNKYAYSNASIKDKFTGIIL